MISVVRAVGRPPLVMWSNPAIPVGNFEMAEPREWRAGVFLVLLVNGIPLSDYGRRQNRQLLSLDFRQRLRGLVLTSARRSLSKRRLQPYGILLNSFRIDATGG